VKEEKLTFLGLQLVLPLMGLSIRQLCKVKIHHIKLHYDIYIYIYRERERERESDLHPTVTTVEKKAFGGSF
jgi:hypothetical protein